MTRYTGPAMTLVNLRGNGVRSILIVCGRGHEASLNVDTLPDFVEVPAVRQRGNAHHAARGPWTCGRIGGKLIGRSKLSRHVQLGEIGLVKHRRGGRGGGELTYCCSISPEHRVHLRQLKAEFDKAFDAIDDPSDHSSPTYRQADACYKKWIKAINAVAIQLLDDLDALEAMVVPSKSPTDPRPKGFSESFEPGDLHSDCDPCAYARRVLGTPDPDIGDDRLLSGMAITFEAIDAGTAITGLSGVALVKSIRKGNSSLP